MPSKFAKKYLKKEERNILLQVLDGRTWHCKYCPGKIRGVWKKFVIENNLKVGDVCVFELTNNQDLTLKVLIFPLEEEPQGKPSWSFFQVITLFDLHNNGSAFLP